MKVIATVTRAYPDGKPMQLKAHCAAVNLDETGKVESVLIRFEETFLIVTPRSTMGAHYFKGGDCVNPSLEVLDKTTIDTTGRN